MSLGISAPVSNSTPPNTGFKKFLFGPGSGVNIDSSTIRVSGDKRVTSRDWKIVAYVAGSVAVISLIAMGVFIALANPIGAIVAGVVGGLAIGVSLWAIYKNAIRSVDEEARERETPMIVYPVENPLLSKPKTE